jgi:hypothetical protein
MGEEKRIFTIPPPTRVVNLKDEDYDVYIGRGSKWGNPFTHIKDKQTLAEHIVETREEAIEKYREYITGNPELMAALPELRNKTLGCYCKPESCHGDILIELVTQQHISEIAEFFKKKVE